MPKKVPTGKHNNYFGCMFTDIRMVIELIEFFFPKELKERIDYKTIEICTNEFTDSELSKKYADVCIKLKISGEDAYINIMFEHKSTNDEGGIDQLRGYNNSRWDKDKSDGKKKRTPIINVLFYHGDGEWKYGDNFNSLYGIKDPKLYRFFMSMPIIVIDLNKLENKDIKGSIDFATAILLFANIREKSITIGKALSKLWSKYSKSEISRIRFMESHVTYILNTRKDETEEEVLENIKKPCTEEKVMTLVDQIEERGKKEGMEEGWKKGRKEGIEEGIEKGIEKGKKDEKMKLAKRMKDHGFPKELVLKLTELDKTDIDRIFD